MLPVEDEVDLLATRPHRARRRLEALHEPDRPRARRSARRREFAPVVDSACEVLALAQAKLPKRCNVDDRADRREVRRGDGGDEPEQVGPCLLAVETIIRLDATTAAVTGEKALAVKLDAASHARPLA